MKERNDSIARLVVEHIMNMHFTNYEYAQRVLKSIKILLGKNSHSYNLPERLETNTRFFSRKSDELQMRLSKINEKEDRRKKEGVFYTDRDVTDYVVANTMYNFINGSCDKVFSYKAIICKLRKCTDDVILKFLSSTILDPTCGAGEFLLSAIILKQTINKNHILSEIEIAKTIYGNDIEVTSVDLTKLRIFFQLIDDSPKELPVEELASIINKNFTTTDAVVYDGVSFGIKDIIVGNPPYVEYNKFEGTTQNQFGNIYADVLKNSIDSLEKNGVMAFVIPLSYVSTARMSKIRDYIREKANKQFVLNFADRPDCLFTGVHQKLTIMIARKNSDQSKIFSSKYHYWYKTEREKLFEEIQVFPIQPDSISFWPKIGNSIELKLYKKMRKVKGDSIWTIKGSVETENLYLNTRACFWMKVFSMEMNSNSYTCYKFPKDKMPFIYCLLNSSLFFLMWVIISDGWHITNKELEFIKIPEIIGDEKEWRNLMNELGTQLENTKKFVGTKQVDYEYKHKECKEIIDRIDNKLSKVFKLSKLQLEFVKNYSLKYRLGDGA